MLFALLMLPLIYTIHAAVQTKYIMSETKQQICNAPHTHMHSRDTPLMDVTRELSMSYKKVPLLEQFS